MRRQIDINWDTIQEIDWARLAAYIDGEGCITISNTKGSQAQYMKVFIANTDPRLMEWCRDNFGGTINGKKRVNREKHKPCYVWTVCSQMAWVVLLGCMPYFIIKREQAEIALSFQRTMSRKRPWVDGRPERLPADVLKFRNQCYGELRRLKGERLLRTSPPPEIIH